MFEERIGYETGRLSTTGTNSIYNNIDYGMKNRRQNIYPMLQMRGKRGEDSGRDLAPDATINCSTDKRICAVMIVGLGTYYCIRQPNCTRE